jgi:8-oxo-dGTP pyrophosphatase MutT (NUDIX family)
MNTNKNNVPYRFCPIKEVIYDQKEKEKEENDNDNDGFQKYSKHYRRKTKSFTSSSNSSHHYSNYNNHYNNQFNHHYHPNHLSYYKRNHPPPPPNHNNKPYYECNNCGKYGHSFNHCKMPIISFGLIVVRYDALTKQFQYLMIRRKDSYGYIDFIRGKYVPQNIRQLKQIIAQMSITEKERLLKEPFHFLWQSMCGNNEPNEEILSERKYHRIFNGIQEGNEWITLKSLIETCPSQWFETEWEFPKGRRNTNEKDLECALREFEEETGISKTNVRVLENMLPFEETFIGTNYKSYKHKYFVAWLPDEEMVTDLTSRLTNFQKSEVSKLEWKSLEECVSAIRPYNVEKRNLVITIDKIMTTFSCYF